MVKMYFYKRYSKCGTQNEKWRSLCTPACQLPKKNDLAP